MINVFYAVLNPICGRICITYVRSEICAIVDAKSIDEGTETKKKILRRDR